MRRSSGWSTVSAQSAVKSVARAKGFSLLEVMVALTITGLALGALFSVIAGNKQLAWRAEAALLRSMQARSLLNLVQLNDEQGEVFVPLDNPQLELQTGIELEEPDRKTEPSASDLRGYEISEDGEVLFTGTYWIKQELPAVAPSAAGQAQEGGDGFFGGDASGNAVSVGTNNPFGQAQPQGSPPRQRQAPNSSNGQANPFGNAQPASPTPLRRPRQ
jgi:prepilin-type N-terminal cleavage/methylation domain-containing protein